MNAKNYKICMKLRGLAQKVENKRLLDLISRLETSPETRLDTIYDMYELFEIGGNIYKAQPLLAQLS